ncbi:MAG: hypothetical protein JXA37_12885 [Chloroflexia bacterium]|nr:hypothetical protein [Chloroflexia bacterium]
MAVLKQGGFTDTWTRRVFRLMFGLMAYRPPRVDVPDPGVRLEGVTVVNPEWVRQTRYEE